MYNIENIAAELQNMDGISELIILMSMPGEIAEQIINKMK